MIPCYVDVIHDDAMSIIVKQTNGCPKRPLCTLLPEMPEGPREKPLFTDLAYRTRVRDADDFASCEVIIDYPDP